MNNGLGRAAPPTWDHVEHYPALRMTPGPEVCERTLSLSSHWRQTYDQGTTPRCFPAGTMVQLADGTWCAIEEMRLLEQVRTAEGNIGTVQQAMVRWYDDDLIRVRLRGHTGVRMTPEHPVLTRQGYVAAKDLEVGDQVALTRSVHDSPTERIMTARYLMRNERKRTQNGTRDYHDRFGGVTTATTTQVPEEIAITPALGRLMGLYMAEGCATKQCIQWSFGGHEKDTLAAETIDLVREALGAEARLQVRPNGQTNVILYGLAWKLIFERLFFQGSGNKRIPPELTAARPEVRQAVLDGWLAGDGHRRRTHVAGITVSPELALGMFTIANDLGLRPTINADRPSLNNHAAHRRERWEVGIAEGGKDHLLPAMDERATWRKVSAIEHEPWLGFVYNLEVAGDNSYVAEGFGVHNCVGYSVSQERSLSERRTFDADWLYAQCKARDGYPGDGTYLRVAYDVMRESGHVAVTRGRGRIREDVNPAYGIERFEWATTIGQIRHAIEAGKAVVVGTNFYARMFTPVRHGSVYWLPKGHEHLGSNAGGHAYLLHRVSDRYEAFFTPNTWGQADRDWNPGEDGWPIAAIPYSLMERLLSEEGEAVLVTDRIAEVPA